MSVINYSENETVAEAVEFDNLEQTSGRKPELPIPDDPHCSMEADCTIVCKDMNVVDLSAAVTKTLEVSNLLFFFIHYLRSNFAKSNFAFSSIQI